jgi:uncharacterized membrane protein
MKATCVTMNAFVFVLQHGCLLACFIHHFGCFNSIFRLLIRNIGIRK